MTDSLLTELLKIDLLESQRQSYNRGKRDLKVVGRPRTAISCVCEQESDKLESGIPCAFEKGVCGGLWVTTRR